jgi:DNA-binding PadR family transcriptional regulator
MDARQDPYRRPADAALPDDPAPALTPTARVILGMIALGKQTGYDIKQLVDKSTRHFWAASYGQIYPELRRLEVQGLIDGQPEPRGGRARTVYRLTPDGESALGQWLESGDGVPFEVRAEGMLKLFFSDVGAPEQRLRILRAMRDAHRRTLTQLRTIEAQDTHMPSGPHLTLQLGIAIHTTIVDWCEDAERRLIREGDSGEDDFGEGDLGEGDFAEDDSGEGDADVD